MEPMRKENEMIIFSFTEAGNQLNEALCTALCSEKIACHGYTRNEYTPKSHAGNESLSCMNFDLSKYIGKNWGKKNFLFIGAVGIAVRMIAPYVKDKFTDSAVLSMDEKGRYVIPVLSGHMGGAVELAKMIGQLMNATPVITTATDINHKFAVDVFAKKNYLIVTDRVAAKKISAAVLNGNEVEIENDGNVVTVSVQSKDDIKLELLPMNLIVGIGCKKNAPFEVLDQNLKTVMDKNGFKIEQIQSLASIDLKKEEPGLLDLAEKYQIPFETFSAEQLSQITNVSSESEFVKQITGVDNVCERAAWFAAEEGELVQEKICMDGTTFAIVRKDIPINFE